MLKKTLISAVLAMGLVASFAPAASADSTQAYTSFNAQKNAWYVYAGGITALSGENIATQDGWLARLGAGYGQFSYSSAAIPGNNVDGDVTAGDLMLGYQHVDGVTRMAAYLGGSVENENLSPRDPNSSASGTRGGVAGAAEVSSQFAANIPARIAGQYSTGFRTYWTLGTVGYNFGSFVLGPQISLLGNKAYNEEKYGAQISGIDLGFANVHFAAGGEHSNRSDSSGAYGEVGLFKGF